MPPARPTPLSLRELLLSSDFGRANPRRVEELLTTPLTRVNPTPLPRQESRDE